nr:MAG TPA: hypothetical protein [Caudoviricetes sp.]
MLPYFLLVYSSSILIRSILLSKMFVVFNT